MSTTLHQRMLSFDYGDGDRKNLMQDIWSGYPWMVNAYSGGYSNNRDLEHDILTWCFDNIGEQGYPIHGKAGAWYRGSATINGWTWFGFSTEQDMQKFKRRWITRDEF